VCYGHSTHSEHVTKASEDVGWVTVAES
jgi:hypothetical protein